MTTQSASDDCSLVFRFEGMDVGYFEGIEAYPASSGTYRYMPFRSVGHYELGEECVRAGLARCSFLGPGGVVWFTVRSTGEYGLLDIRDLGAAP
jgi:hypothetical protein